MAGSLTQQVGFRNSAIATAPQLDFATGSWQSLWVYRRTARQLKCVQGATKKIAFACRSLPSSLLLLSRAFTVTQPLSKDKESTELESLKDTLSSMPREVIDEIAMARPADGYGASSTATRFLVLSSLCGPLAVNPALKLPHLQLSTELPYCMTSAVPAAGSYSMKPSALPQDGSGPRVSTETGAASPRRGAHSGGGAGGCGYC